jgi:phosphoglycolate phosphatase
MRRRPRAPNQSAGRYTNDRMIHAYRSIPVDRIRLLIFDLDGTLVDSKADIAHAVNAMLHDFGRPPLAVDVIGSYIGDGAPTLIQRSLGDSASEKDVKQGLEFFMLHYREHLLDNTYAYAGVMEGLELIQRESAGHVRMAVLSNKPERPSQRICEGLGLSRHLVAVYGGNTFKTKKPDPLGANSLLQLTDTKPEAAVMIGDSSNDVVTARNAGMWALGVTYGFSPETLETHRPDVLVDSVSEMIEALGFGKNGARK